MAKTVLEYVTDYLSDASSDLVESIEDTEESLQVAKLLRSVYYEWIEREEFAWLEKGFTLTEAASASTPTSFTLPADVTKIAGIRFLRYNIDETGSNPWYRPLIYLAPEEFLRRQAGLRTTSATTHVTVDNQPFYVYNNKMPEYWTALTPTTIVMDGHKASIDPWLDEAKLHGRALYRPSFTLSDSFEPTVPLDLEPTLQAMLNAAAFNHFKESESTPDERRQQRQHAGAVHKNTQVRGNNDPSINRFGRGR